MKRDIYGSLYVYIYEEIKVEATKSSVSYISRIDNGIEDLDTILDLSIWGANEAKTMM